MKLTMKDIHKLEVNEILRESYKAKKEKDEKKLVELRNILAKKVSEATLRGYDNYIASI